MTILGIDPGLATVGFGVLRYEKNNFSVIEYGAVLTKHDITLSERLCEIYDNICELCNTYHPHAASIEEIFFNTNQKTAVAVSQARGVILLALKKQGIPVYEYTPLQIKQAVTGYGRAEKKQIIYMVQNILKLPSPPKPDDTADALAAAICHSFSSSSKLFGLD